MRAVIAALVLCGCGARTELAGTKVSAGDASIDVPSSGCHDEIIAKDAKGAAVLALDGDVVFWGTQDGFVRMRDASGTTTLASEATSINGIAADANNVYYTLIGSVHSVPRKGGQSVEIVSHAGQPFALVRAERLFWVDYGSGIAAGSVHSAGTDGSGLATLATELDTPSGLGIDDSHAFFAAALALVDQQGVMGPLIRTDHDGGNPVVLASGLHEPASVATFGGRVYYIEQTDATSTLHGGVRSMDADGGAPKVEAQTDGYLPIDLAVDESGVYVTALSQVEAALFHDGAEIAATQGVVYEAVRTSATAVYWTIAWTSASPPPADGATVRKLCK